MYDKKNTLMIGKYIMKTFAEKKIGIWGLGIVGRSAIRYLTHHTTFIGIIDKSRLSEDDKKIFHHTLWYDYANLDHFLADHDYILPSPGIDLQPYHTYGHKWLSEIDIFVTDFKKPIIAATGSVGKTTIVHLLSQIITNSGYTVAAGGNIGIGMLDLLLAEKIYDYALLELSSFQLALSKKCTPDLAIITNIVANHLDRHNSLDEYIDAKFKILTNQNQDQIALVPYELIHELKKRDLFDRPLVFFSLRRPLDITHVLSTHSLFFIENNTIIKWHAGKETALYSCAQLPPCSFMINWLIIIAALSLLNISTSGLLENHSLTIPEHRLEFVAIKKGITFYNDSKSTLPAATLAAVNALPNTPILLLLGGTSKGVNRQPLIQQLPATVKHTVCFGAEALQLKNFCDQTNLSAYACNTLEDAFEQVLKLASAGECVLLSPAGASYDLFKNYEQRGNCFKQLVHSL